FELAAALFSSPRGSHMDARKHWIKTRSARMPATLTFFSQGLPAAGAGAASSEGIGSDSDMGGICALFQARNREKATTRYENLAFPVCEANRRGCLKVLEFSGKTRDPRIFVEKSSKAPKITKIFGSGRNLRGTSKPSARNCPTCS